MCDWTYVFCNIALKHFFKLFGGSAKPGQPEVRLCNNERKHGRILKTFDPKWDRGNSQHLSSVSTTLVILG